MEVDKDHIHLLVDYTPDVSVSQIVRLLKQMTTAKIWFSHRQELAKYFWLMKCFGLLVTLFVQPVMLQQKLLPNT
jgi:putative transposase